ncbi:MAG: deoxyribonuclease IV [Anaerolineales bacterium]
MDDFLFGTVGSPISTPAKPGGSIGAVIHTATLGLGALELGWVRSVRVSEKTCTEIRTTGQTHGVALSVHAPYYINLNADENEWPKSRQRLMDAARYGALAGATDIVFHPGSYFGRSPEEVLPTATARLATCQQELHRTGIFVTLRPETMGKSAMLGSLEDTLHMSRAIEGVEPCLDFAHLYARPGDGSLNDRAAWERMLSAYANALGEASLRRLHIHLSGIAYGPKGEKEHLPLADSGLDLQAIFDALHTFGCAGRILCESPIMEEDARFMQKTWQATAAQS